MYPGASITRLISSMAAIATLSRISCQMTVLSATKAGNGAFLPVRSRASGSVNTGDLSNDEHPRSMKTAKQKAEYWLNDNVAGWSETQLSTLAVLLKEQDRDTRLACLEEPMNAIERTKHEGAVNALSRRIDCLKFELTSRNWDAIRDGAHYCRLGDAIDDAENILRQMRETLAALQELEPDNR